MDINLTLQADFVRLIQTKFVFKHDIRAYSNKICCLLWGLLEMYMHRDVYASACPFTTWMIEFIDNYHLQFELLV